MSQNTPEHALTPYDYHEIVEAVTSDVDAVASSKLAKLLAQHCAPSSLTRFYVRMPNPKFDVVIQTVGAIGSQAFKVFPASYWTSGTTEEAADSIRALYTQLDHLMTEYTAAAQHPEDQPQPPPSDDADDVEFFTYHAQQMGNAARTTESRVRVIQRYAFRLRGIADKLQAHTNNIAHPELVNATIEQIDKLDLMLREQAGESILMAEKLRQMGMENLKIAEDPELADSPEIDAVLGKFESDYQIYNETSLTRLSALASEHDRLTNLVLGMLRQPNEKEFDIELQSAIHALEREAAKEVAIKNQADPVTPSYEHQLGLVLEGISQMKSVPQEIPVTRVRHPAIGDRVVDRVERWLDDRFGS